jgi:hypothetical protein
MTRRIPTVKPIDAAKGAISSLFGKDKKRQPAKMFLARLAKFDNLKVLVYVFDDLTVKYEYVNNTRHSDAEITEEIEKIIKGEKENTRKESDDAIV